jgi:DNA-binding NtrC family response regulator
MRNILLILENSLEFDLTKTVLQRLGFNVFWIQKGVDMHEKLSKNFPDLVITSVLGTQDEFLNEFLKVRVKRGTPQFIWVGPTSRLDKLTPAQRKLIDANLPTPIQPDLLIQNVCRLFQVDAVDYLKRYREMMLGANNNDLIKVTGAIATPTSISDPVRSTKYKAFLENVPKLDRVFSLREIDKRLLSSETKGNTQDLLEKKKSFIKALFKK